MLTASNALSLARIPLAFLFLQENATLRILAIILAMITDSIDGYVARRSRQVSRFGIILDPITDKFFVCFALAALFLENKMALWEVAAMLARDFFLCIFSLFLILAGRWKTFIFRSILWGKVTTALQFIVLIGVVLGAVFPWYIYASFIVMGWLAFLELFQTRTSPA